LIAAVLLVSGYSELVKKPKFSFKVLNIPDECGPMGPSVVGLALKTPELC
jgi:hypothetical protein